MRPTLALIGRSLVILLLGLTWWAPSRPVALASPETGDLSMRIETPEYELSVAGVKVPGYASNTLPGAPSLPVRGFTFDLPASGDWELTFELVGSRVLTERVTIPSVPVPDLDLNGPTSLDDLETLPASVPVINRPDPAIYAADAFYPASPVLAGEAMQQGDKRILPVRVFPFQYNPVTRELLYHPDLRISVRLHGAELSPEAATAPVNAQPKRAVPATNVEFAVRVYTRERGLYRLTYNELAAAGIPVGSGGRDPRKFVLYNDGQPVDIQLIGGADGVFNPGDLVIFYAVPHTGRFQNYNVYSLAVTDQPNTAIMSSRSVSAPSVLPPTSTITQTVHVEYDRDYRSLYERPMNVDHWFDTQLYANVSAPTVTRDYDLNLDDPVTASGTLDFTALIHGGNSQPATPDQSVVIRLNSHSLGQFTWDGSIDHTITASLPASWLDSSPNRITLEAALTQLTGVAAYWISPDWIELKYPAAAEAELDRIYIEGKVSASPNIAVTGFSSPDARVYDVRQPTHPVLLTGVAARIASGVFTMAWIDAVSNPSYYLSTLNALLAPSAVEADALSNWASPDHDADYIVIVGAQRSFNGTTALGGELSDALQQQNLTCWPIAQPRGCGSSRSTFSTSTMSSATAKSIPKRSVIFSLTPTGIGTKAVLGRITCCWWAMATTTSPVYPPSRCPICCRPIWYTSTHGGARCPQTIALSAPTDQTIIIPNMAVGRLPVNYADDVTAMVNKILTYESTTLNPPGPWQQRAVYAADDCANSAGDFHTLSNYGRLQWLPSAYTNRKIYYSLKDPNGNFICPDGTHSTSAELKAAVRGAFDQGALFIQWFGHGSQTQWGSRIAFHRTDNPC